MADPARSVTVERVEPRRGYAICTVMRSGSTWLAEALGSTGVLGKPSEYFSTTIQRQLIGPDYPADRRAQVAHILSEGATPNGIYGFKLFPVYFNEITQRVDLQTAFPDLRLIYLRRRDVLGQAISRVRAQQTRQWRSSFQAVDAAVYDGDTLLAALRTTVLQDARWELYFARNTIEPLRLIYEDMMTAPQSAIDAIADLVEVSPRPVLEPERIAIEMQRDALNVEWRARFLSTYGDRNWLDEF